MTLEEQIIEHEGIRLKPYRCTAGKLTIGVGRNLDDRGITQGEALMLLQNDLVRIFRECEREMPFFRSLSDGRQRVLMDMAFNLGIGGLLRFKNMLAAVVHGDWVKAEREMRDSAWAYQVQPSRVERLCRMMLEG